MRKAHKVWTGIAAGVFCLVAVTDLAGPATPSAGTVASSSSLPTTSTAAPASAPPGGAAAAPAATSARAVEVIDGDTFRLASGDEVRVLGIDSCEALTPGGQRASAAARSRLLVAPVELTAEPGVDRDPYGRLLRYVAVGGADYASAMVTEDHTAIYTRGRNDASPTVQAALRRLDTDGRVCGTAETTTTTSPTPVPDPDPDVDRPRTPRPVAPRTAAQEPSGGGGAAYYKNCAAARAVGAAPIRAGQPGYRAALDRDGDGTACDT
ncbi:excalibur calcium-binding domain-containing protein [Actinomycetospora cinnamomea]|uniref:Endonuclease YncB(Thermonuclease family) n=1 Tax=Actinomycetospora cinnamomea TaxID=663609 RepID=A0A2U1EA06_9PSEU|nr:excalibur calcium-binding domain-containing protein [Actinomycetospora cinnamomea]PVY96712.1 endonuclease YncB(thermonuclease family) [Actinomycetospora cinnamomea]